MDKLKRTRISAYALIPKSDQILLCRISDELPRWKGLWTLPGGGIDFGEDPASAMIREVREETGLNVVPVSIAKIDSIVDLTGDEDFHGIRIIYNVKVTGGTIDHEKSGTTDLCQWHPISINDKNLVGLAITGLNHLKESQKRIEQLGA